MQNFCQIQLVIEKRLVIKLINPTYSNNGARAVLFFNGFYYNIVETYCKRCRVKLFGKIESQKLHKTKWFVCIIKDLELITLQFREVNISLLSMNSL